jgi:hypothetical protein
MDDLTPDIDRRRDATDRDRTRVIVPYIDGMLRESTRRAVIGSGIWHEFHPLAPGDAAAYAAAFEAWWPTPGDIIVIEQDIAPAAGMIEEMAICRNDWCVRPYHIGAGRYTRGLGMAKFSNALRQRHIHAGANAAKDPTGERRFTGYLGLNEQIESHLFRLGARQCIHYPAVAHLHYPLGAGDG